jgi:predicted NBD/HSP70 family sugar kinase
LDTTGLNQDNSRIHNRSLILKLIKTHPGITRKGLSKSSGLSRAAITKIVNPFLENGVIAEEQNSNIRNKGLYFSQGNFYIIAIYLGRLSITGALYDLGGTVLVRKQLPKGVKFYGNDDLPEHSYHLIEMLIQDSSVDKNKILAIGIAAPGAVSFKRGIVFNRSVPLYSSSQHIPFNWGKIHLVEYLEEKIGVPVFIENNSNLSALAESWFGKGIGVKNFVQYSIGLGIGGGAIFNGQLFRGNDMIACEIGHITIQQDGELCFCGNRGCLEAEAGFKRIAELYYQTPQFDDEDILLEKLALFFKNVEQHEEKATALFRVHTHKLAIGAVTLINLFSPEKLIISTNDVGGISLSGLVKDIEIYVRKHAYPVIAETVSIELSELGEDIHLEGAYALILENLYTLLTNKRGLMQK